MTLSAITRPAPRAARSGLFARMAALHGLWRQRKALAELDPHMLNDIGVTEAQALKEARRPLWDAPANWMA
ncbi:MAG: DUF1127 domain-containing protein [Rhodobacteraceae bacterium]|nr:DUF1127 domain-containing protein [Paracoccaceae bacterium]